MRQQVDYDTANADKNRNEEGDDVAQHHMDFPQIIGVNEAAEILGKSRATVYRWIAENKLDAQEFLDRTVLSREQVINLARQERGLAIIAFNPEEFPLTGDVRLTYEATADSRVFVIKIIAMNGESLIGEWVFDEDPNAWIDRVVERQREREEESDT